MILLGIKDSYIATKTIRTLKKIGYESIYTSSPEEIIILIKNNPAINLIIIDIDSFNNIIILTKAILTSRNLPIIHLTSKNNINLIEKDDDPTCYGYLYKDSNDFIFDSTIKTAFNFFRKHKDLKKESETKKIEYENIFYNHQAIMLVIDSVTTKITRVNLAATKFYGWSKEEMLNMKLSNINTLDDEEIKINMQLANSRKKSFFSFQHRLANGTIKDIDVCSEVITLDNTRMLFLIIRDVTEHKKFENEIKHLAYLDSLTSLPNHKQFSDKLNQIISKSEKNNLNFALIYIDLDNFKKVNDSFGHLIGNKLLIEFAKRLENILCVNSHAFRLGGDEFAIIVKNISTKQDVSIISNKIIKQLKEPFFLNKNKIFSSASIGISLYPNDGLSYDSLLKNSDTAMYKVKNSGKNNFLFYEKHFKITK